MFLICVSIVSNEDPRRPDTHITYIHIYNILPEAYKLEHLHQIDLAYASMIGVKCNFPTSKPWIMFEKSIYYFKYAKNKYELMKLDLATNEFTSI